MKGFIEPEKDVKISVKYLPGIPEKFSKSFLLQISHFAPDEILIQGDASFAEILLDLPRFENDFYKDLLVVRLDKLRKPGIELSMRNVFFFQRKRKRA